MTHLGLQTTYRGFVAYLWPTQLRRRHQASADCYFCFDQMDFVFYDDHRDDDGPDDDDDDSEEEASASN